MIKVNMKPDFGKTRDTVGQQFGRVTVQAPARFYNLSPTQARDLAARLVDAADRAEVFDRQERLASAWRSAPVPSTDVE